MINMHHVNRINCPDAVVYKSILDAYAFVAGESPACHCAAVFAHFPTWSDKIVINFFPKKKSTQFFELNSEFWLLLEYRYG